MKVKSSIDRPKLERSLKRFARDFGESNSQAVIRWSVQSCREIALETLPFKSKGSASAKKQQKQAIQRDLGRVVYMEQKISRKRTSKKIIRDAGDAISWMDDNRTSNNRTKKLPIVQKKICSKTVFNKTVSTLMKNAGIAKGGFIGAGQKIAMAQRGQDRIRIGKNFLSYAQKHERFGNATRPRSGFKPTATIHNRAAHTSKSYVIKKMAMKKAISWGLKKTVKWYAAALRRQNKKKT